MLSANLINPNKKSTSPPITTQETRSPITEAYHGLRINLLSASDNNHVYVITSPGPKEGKSTTAANLAVTMAESGLRVMLIDADLRRPRSHELFELQNDKGLSTLLLPAYKGGEISLKNGRTKFSKILKPCLQDAEVSNLRVITSGLPPAQNPSVMLGSSLMQQWIEAFRGSENIDVILIDTPPCLVVPDSITLAESVAAEVLLVVEAGRTKQSAAQKAKERFQQVGIEVKGVILNKTDAQLENYYDYEGYYYD